MKDRFFLYIAATFIGVVLLYGKVSSDYDHNADFTKYRTYSWVQLKATSDLWKDRIEAAVDSQLSAKGWNKIPSGGDASVSAFGSRESKNVTQTYYNDLGGLGWGYGWRGRWGGSWGGLGESGTATTTIEQIPVGTLVVDIFDSATKKMIWQGESSETLSEKPDKNEKKLEKSTEEMFKDFPPKSRG